METTKVTPTTSNASNNVLSNEKFTDPIGGHSLTSLEGSAAITPASKTSSDQLRQSNSNLKHQPKGRDDNDAGSVLLADDDYSSSGASSIFYPTLSTLEKANHNVQGGYQSDEDSHITDDLSISSRDQLYGTHRQRSLRRSQRAASRRSLGNESRKHRRHIAHRSSSRASLNSINKKIMLTTPYYQPHEPEYLSMHKDDFDRPVKGSMTDGNSQPHTNAPKLSTIDRSRSSSNLRRSRLPIESYDRGFEKNRKESSMIGTPKSERRRILRSASTAGTRDHPKKNSPAGAHVGADRLYKTIGSRDQRQPTRYQQLSASIGRRPSRPDAGHKEQSAIMEYPISYLDVVKDIGEAEFITVQLAKAKGLRGIDIRFVALKRIKNPFDKAIARKFFQEVAILNKIKHRNVTRLLAISTQNQVLATVIEYPEYGNLQQYLRQAANESDSSQPGNPPISVSCLLFMAKQIVEGMQYLTSLDIVHRDLATRNCLVGSSYLIKVSNFGVVNRDFMHDYYIMDDLPPLPIRWMAPEAMLEGDITTSSDVWAFGITLWEILTFAKRPYEDKNDVEVLENIIKLYEGGEDATTLNQPVLASNECYKLMHKCWRLDPKRRPSFKDIVAMFS